jgi:PAS domain S-box-containing protein
MRFMGRARRPRIGLTARVRLATLVVAVALGAVLGILLHTVDVSRQRDSEARHSSDVLESAAGIEGSVIDLETGLRGYIISRQTRFLQPYQRARATQPARLRALSKLVAEDPGQVALSHQLSRQLGSYVNDYAVPLIAAVEAGRRIGVRRLSEGKGRVDGIRATLGRFTSVEDRRQAERRLAANSAAHRARILTILSVVLLFVFVVLSGAFASRYVAEPLRRLARSARRLAAGRLEERVVPAGAAELSDLGLAFNQMAASLEQHTEELERLSESSAAQFSAIFEQTPIGLTLFDLELHCLRSNPALGELTGSAASLHEGRTVPEVFAGFEPDLEPEFARVLDSGRPLSALRLTGRGRTCTVGLFPVRRRDGELTGVAAVVVDVTDREQRLERERLAARRARQLSRLTAAISEALTPEEISRAVVAEAVSAIGGDGGAVMLLDSGGHTVTRSAALGRPLEHADGAARIPLTARTPVTDAIRMRRVVRRGKSLALPLLSGPSCVGGLLVTFAEQPEFDAEERQFAEAVAERCAAGIGRALLYEREHETAAALQRSLIPTALPNFDGVAFGARFRPAGRGEVVGGDFYDVVALGPSRFVAWIGDVQGKGPAAAAVAALARYTLRAETRHETRPAALLRALNEAVIGQSEPGDRLLTAACIAGAVHDDRLELELSIAGHPPALLARRGQPCAEWGSPRPLIGLENADFGTETLTLEPGELLVLYTDGLTDANAPRAFVGPGDLCRLMDELPGETSLGDVLDRLLARAGGEAGDAPRDDIALLGMHFAPRTERGANALLAAERRFNLGGASGPAPDGELDLRSR